MDGHASDETLARLRRACADEGVRLTQQRLLVYQALRDCCDHPSAEMLHERLREAAPTLALDTVYRTLTMLAEKQLAWKLPGCDGRARYDADVRPHHHFFCRGCQRVEDFAWPAFEQLPTPAELGRCGRIEFKQVRLVGLCRDCIGKQSGSEGTA